MAPVTDPGPMGRQRWPVAGSTAQATSGAQPRWRCRSSVQPLQRWVVPIGEGLLWGGEQLCRPPATAAAVERVTRRKGCASRPGGRPLRSGGWVFLAAAGGCGIGFWIARRPARGCGGRRRLWDRGGARWVAEVHRCGRVLLDAWLGPSLSPVNLEPCCSSRRPRLMPSRQPNGRRFAPRLSAFKFRKVASPQALLPCQ